MCREEREVLRGLAVTAWESGNPESQPPWKWQGKQSKYIVSWFQKKLPMHKSQERAGEFWKSVISHD